MRTHLREQPRYLVVPGQQRVQVQQTAAGAACKASALECVSAKSHRDSEIVIAIVAAGFVLIGMVVITMAIVAIITIIFMIIVTSIIVCSIILIVIIIIIIISPLCISRAAGFSSTMSDLCNGMRL